MSGLTHWTQLLSPPLRTITKIIHLVDTILCFHFPLPVLSQGSLTHNKYCSQLMSRVRAGDKLWSWCSREQHTTLRWAPIQSEHTPQKQPCTAASLWATASTTCVLPLPALPGLHHLRGMCLRDCSSRERNHETIPKASGDRWLEKVGRLRLELLFLHCPLL